MDIHQISVQFVAPEDRLLLRVSTQSGEMASAWLTRRLVAGLWTPLDRLVSHGHVALERPHAMVMPEARDMLAQASRSKALEKADFATEFQAGSNLPELADGPMLVTEVKLTPRSGGRLAIQWRDPKGREVALNLDTTSATALQSMVRQAVKLANWSLPVVLGEDEPVPVAAQAAPRVLN